MIIESIRIMNFRCIYDETLPCENLTAIIGPNGAGKSSFLKALDIFYDPQAKIMEDDFYNNNTLNDISISVTYNSLTNDEKLLFKKYMRNDKLTIEKVVKWQNGRLSQRYHGRIPKNPAFQPFRDATGSGRRSEYQKLQTGDYFELSAYTNKDEAENSLQKWEELNSDKCELKRDDGQFFGFKEVGNANLGRYTKFIYVPAVHDASEEASDGRGSALNEIMDIVVRSVFEKNEEYIKLQNEAQERYANVVNSKTKELNDLQSDLSNILNIYVPESEVKLKWTEEELIKLPTPKAKIKLVEDDYSSLVENTGHGLQRAFVMTLFQFLASMQSSNLYNNEFSPIQNLIIGIEEPEIYQHPNRQRHLSRIFYDLSTNGLKGTVDKVQVIYTTHSPLFVGIDRLDNIRKLHKVKEKYKEPKRSKVNFTCLNTVAGLLNYTATSLDTRLQAVMTPWMNEAFFSDLTVLVEGEEDRAAIMGLSAEMGYDLESMGISVIPCMGKQNIDKLLIIFREFKIPLYCIWDSDYGNDEEKRTNKKLLRLVNYRCKEDWPEIISYKFACFKENLGTTLKNEIGASLFDPVLTNFMRTNQITKEKKALKRTKFIQEVIKVAKANGKSCKTLETIITNIVYLRNGYSEIHIPDYVLDMNLDLLGGLKDL